VKILLNCEQCPSTHHFEAKSGCGMKMEKVQWYPGLDEVIMEELVVGVRGREREDTKACFYRQQSHY